MWHSGRSRRPAALQPMQERHVLRPGLPAQALARPQASLLPVMAGRMSAHWCWVYLSVWGVYVCVWGGASDCIRQRPSLSVHNTWRARLPACVCMQGDMLSRLSKACFRATRVTAWGLCCQSRFRPTSHSAQHARHTCSAKHHQPIPECARCFTAQGAPDLQSAPHTQVNDSRRCVLGGSRG